MTVGDILMQEVISLLKNDTIISSASQNKTNRVIDIQYGGLNSSFDQALEALIIDLIGKHGATSGSTAVGSSSSSAVSKNKKGLESKIISTAQKSASVVQNPAVLVEMGLRLLPHAAVILFALKIIPLIFQELTKAGGPYDLRFKRIIDDEINAFLSRQTQKDTEMGVRPVIIQSKTGFTATNGVNNYNTVRGIREGGINKERLDRIGMVDHSKGVFDF